jgi:hypothetical protein
MFKMQQNSVKAEEKLASPAISITPGSASTIEIDDPATRVKDEFLGSVQQHPFSSPVAASYWSNIYENCKYECRHRFNASAEWTPSAEKRLVRKVPPVLRATSL